MQNIRRIIDTAKNSKYVRVIPSIDIDSLIASGILSKYLSDEGVNTIVSLNIKSIVDENTLNILIGFNEQSIENRQNLLYIEKTQNSSISAQLLHSIGRSIDNWRYFGKLSIVAGQYRMLDLGEKGFQGYEKNILDELARIDEVEYPFIFRFWGFNKRPLKESLYRTIYPFLPGISGDIEAVEKITSRFPGISDTETVREFAQTIFNVLESDPETKEKIMHRIIGYIYVFKMMNGRKIDSSEILGALMTYSVLDRRNPVDIPYIVYDEENLNHILAYYEEYIDVVSPESSMVIKQILRERTNIVETDYITRPELLVDILDSIDKLDILGDKPLIVSYNGEKYTCIREMLRIGKSLEELINLCDHHQLCMVE